MSSLFTYSMLANNSNSPIESDLCSVINQAATSPVYLGSNKTYTQSSGSLTKPNISILAFDNISVAADAITKANGFTILCGGTYTTTPGFLGSADGRDIYVRVTGVYMTAAFRCGSSTYGVLGDGNITAIIDSGYFAKATYAGGRNNNASAVYITIHDGNFTQGVYGGCTYNGSPVSTNTVGTTNMHIAGGTFASNAIGSSRLDTTDNKFQARVGTSKLYITGGTFTKPGNSTDPGTMILGGAYVIASSYGSLTSAPGIIVDSATVDIDTDTPITGAIYAGSYCANYGYALVVNATINFRKGYADRVLGNGWTQTGGVSYVSNSTINIYGGTIDRVYAGGANGNNSYNYVTDTANINVYGGTISHIYLGGRYGTSIVACHSAATIYSDDASLYYVAGFNGNGATPEGSGTRELVVAASCTIGAIYSIDRITIHSNKTLTTTADAELNKINLVTDSVALPWTIISGADLSGIATVKFAVNGTDVVVDWDDSGTSGVLGDTGYSLSVNGNVLTLS